MSPEELDALCAVKRSMGLDHIILTQPMPKSWNFKYQKGIRTPFGIGRICGSTPDNKAVIFWIEISKVEKYLKKILKPTQAQPEKKEK